MTSPSASQSARDDRRNLRRIMGWLPAWAHDHPVAWQTLYVVYCAASVAMLLSIWHIVRGGPPDWAEIAASTGAVTIVLSLLYIWPHRNG